MLQLEDGLLRDNQLEAHTIDELLVEQLERIGVARQYLPTRGHGVRVARELGPDSLELEPLHCPWPNVGVQHQRCMVRTTR
jgi:hypothetical protein